jgi:arylsulfatase A-like enzyme
MTKPNTICERTIDFMCIYPTLTDLCGIPTPAHNEGESIRALLTNPQAPWDKPGVTTYRYKNHTTRTADWRYIRYANGDEELYDETKDPNEWTNLATKPEFAAKKAELAGYFPKSDVPDPGGKAGAGAEEDEKKPRKGKRKNKEE